MNWICLCVRYSLLLSESLSGKCTNLHTVVASNDRDMCPDHFIIACSCQTYMGVVVCTHHIHGESHIHRHANHENSPFPQNSGINITQNVVNSTVNIRKKTS